MASKTTGIQSEKNGTWSIDKIVRGKRLRERGFKSFKEANDWLAKKVHEKHVTHRLGERPPKTFDSAAAHYLQWSAEKISLESEIYQLVSVMPYIKDMDLTEINDLTLQPYIKDRLAAGIMHKTINLTLGVVGHILNLCVSEFKYENQLSWLEFSPKFKKLELEGFQREPAPITWEEQENLMSMLEPHLQRMALFTINTGIRDNVTCNLKWEWELYVKELNVSVFVVPKGFVKGQKKFRVFICNSISQKILEEVRGMHPEYVFVYRRERTKRLGKPPKMAYRPVQTMNNSGWQTATKKAGLDGLHGHDLRHTTGTRLREAEVADGTIADLLWHARHDMTSHYTLVKLQELAVAIEKITTDAGRWNRTLEHLLKERKIEIQAKANSS